MLFLQIINSILGSGLLGLPSVFNKMGILLGQFIMTCVFIIMGISGLLLLLRLPDREEDRLESLTKHMKASLKSRWMQLTASGIVLLGIFLQEFGALVSYIFLIMSDFKHLNPIAVSCFLFIILLWLTIIDITKISGFSILAMVIFMIYKMSFIAMKSKLTCNETMLEDKIAAVMESVIKSVNNDTNTTIVPSASPLTIQLPPSNITFLELWKSISTCMFAVTCQTTLVGLACIHGSARLKRHFLIGLLFVWVVYTTITICDIYIFPKITDNILDTFLVCIPGAVFVSAFYKISILTTIPVLFISVCGEFPYINHIIIKAIWLAIAILMANFFTSLGWILAIFGFIAGSLNIVIVPIMAQAIIIK